MINKKISRAVKSASLSMAFCMMINTSVIPVMAHEIRSEKALECMSDNTANVIEQNGVKIKVSDIKASRNRVRITLNVECSKELINVVQEDLEIVISLNNGKNSGYIYLPFDEDSKDITVEEELEDEEGFPEKDILSIYAVCGKLDINTVSKIPVDFTEAFKREYTGEINFKLNDNEVIEKLRSNDISTDIIVSTRYDGDYGSYDKEKILFRKFIAKVDEKYYMTAFPQYEYGDDKAEFNKFELIGLPYETVTNSKNIDLIVFENNMSDDEMDKFYNSDDCMKYCKEMKEKDNMSYPENVKFNDGTTGSVEVKRDEGKIRIIIKGDSDKHSMIMMSALNIIYGDDEEAYYGRSEMINAYKDKDYYIAEFKDIMQDKKLNISMDGMIYNIDKYSIYDEIKVK